MSKNRVELQINGERHAGWKEVTISRGLDQVADRFDMTLTERWSDNNSVRPLKAGSACAVLINGVRVITGYIDDVLPAYDSTQHSIVVSGRSKTADLVDCSQRRRTWEKPQKLEQIARDLAEPFGIKVVVETDTGKPLRASAVEAGQPIYEALEQMARYRAVILLCDESGNLVITKAPRSNIETALELGENILVGSGQFSVRNRFSQVIIQGQQPGDDNTFGDTSSSPEGKALDNALRYRTQVIIADTPTDTAGCQSRADNEVRRRRGQGRGLTYTVAGWQHKSGVWRPGDMVPVKDHWLGIDEARLIESVQLVLDEQGERAEIRLVPRSAWDLVAEPEKDDDTEWT